MGMSKPLVLAEREPLHLDVSGSIFLASVASAVAMERSLYFFVIAVFKTMILSFLI